MSKDQIDNENFDDVENNQNEFAAEEESENDEYNSVESETEEEVKNSELDEFVDDPNEETPLLSDVFEESEEEKLRRKKAKKRAVVVSACSVFVIAVCVFAFVFINQYSNKFIMTVDGKKISVEEYKLFYYTSSDTEDAKNSSLESLQQFIAIENFAKAKNLTLTDEEKEEAAANAQSFKESFLSAGYEMPVITDERLTEIMGIDALYTKLYDLLISEYTVDDSDFEEQYEDYITNYKADYIEAEYKYIMSETEENAQKAKEMIEAGGDITEAAAQYSVDYTEGEEVPILSISDISYYFAPEDTEHLLTLSEGQVSDIIPYGGAYYMVFVTQSMHVPTTEEVRESFTQMYYENKKYYMFVDEIEAFQNEAEIKVNQKLLDTFA